MRTDLAKESRMRLPNMEGIREETETADGAEILRIDVQTDSAAKQLDKPIGRYVTVTASKADMMDRERRASLSQLLAKEIRNMAGSVQNAMVIGLGNRYVAADALGTKTAEHVFVTRHIHAHMKDILPQGTPVVSAFCANVLGVTGMETVEVVSALVREIRPQLVLLVDSLAATEIKHLGCVMQCNDSGIAPGSGVGNFRSVLSEDSLHVPVIALGVPLVVSAETILESCGCDPKHREDLRYMIVAPKEIDAMVKDASRVLTDAVNLALFGDNYTELEKLLR